MKRILTALLTLSCLALATGAWAQSPNIRQSINYFITYYNEASVQGMRGSEYLEKENINQVRPYTEEYVFFTELNNRIDKSLILSINLCDLYYIYNKATYCFTVDEKKYLLNRIANIQDGLLKLRNAPYNVPAALLEDKQSKAYASLTEFNARIDKLRDFTKSSLVVFQY
jgi:hypothetical protein